MQDNALEKKSHSPLYQQLMSRLKNDIMAEVYPSGGRIPSEQALCDTYGVSRVTVRKAILDLVQEGLLIRRQGKGTFVADKRLQRDLLHITSFTDACRLGGRTAGTKVVSLQREIAGSDDMERLGMAEGEQVLEICRLRLSSGDPVMLEINRFPQKYGFLEHEDLGKSLYDLLKKQGVVPSHGVHDISLGHATPMVSKFLNTSPGEALLILDQVVFDQQGQPLHTSRQWIRGDKYTFRI